MSTLYPVGELSKEARGDTRPVRHSPYGDLRFRRVIGTADTNGFFHGGVLLHNPGAWFQVKLERTCSGTPCRRANSTIECIKTRPPVAEISIISSKETLEFDGPSRPREDRPKKDTRHVGVESHRRRPSGPPRARPPVTSEPPRPKVVMSRRTSGVMQDRSLMAHADYSYLRRTSPA